LPIVILALPAISSNIRSPLAENAGLTLAERDDVSASRLIPWAPLQGSEH
jgi:hypothetical protein